MTDSSRDSHKSYRESYLTMFPALCPVLAGEGWRRGRGARSDPDVPHVQLPDQPPHRGSRALRSPRCHGC